MSLESSKSCSVKPVNVYTGSDAVGQSLMSSFWNLTKPRLSFMSVASAIFGYFAAIPDKNLSVFISLLIGTSLAAGGSAAINQWMERIEDGLMERTADRPIPSGAINPTLALWYGITLSFLGSYILFVGTNAYAGVLVLATIVSYLVFYTPLKKVSVYATEIGAIPGALPPLIGWVAATGEFSILGWVLFGVLFAWQIPHFMAICWTYREEYHKAGYVMLSMQNNGAIRAARKSLIYTLALIAITSIPFFTDGDSTGLIYKFSFVLLNLYFLKFAIGFSLSKDKNQSARKLFFASIVYLPIFLITFVFDRYFVI
jgi:protoheme IX farnesyltransferase